jgi:hypothetical protein
MRAVVVTFWVWTPPKSTFLARSGIALSIAYSITNVLWGPGTALVAENRVHKDNKRGT